MKLIILGAGIAGALAGGYFRSQSPLLFDQREEGSDSKHKAVFRFKNPDIGLVLGCPLKKIEVAKSIYKEVRYTKDGGDMVEIHSQQPTIADCNAYSLKVVGSLQGRSIRDVSPLPAVRYVLKGQFTPSGVFWGCKVKKVKPHEIIFSTSQGDKVVMFDKCISTIPLPSLLKAIDGKRDWGVDFDEISSSIFVTIFHLKCKSDVVQTIYYPKGCAYRATLEGDKLIVESVKGVPSDYRFVFRSFGLAKENFQEESEVCEQKYGKLMEIDQDYRKTLLFDITEGFGIYSLGRYALWKNLRTDDLLSDLSAINRMMEQPLSSIKYDQKKRMEGEHEQH